MAAGAFGKVGAKLVDDFGASADEAARIINELDPDTVKALDENPRFLDEIGDLRIQTQSGDAGSLSSRIRNIGRSGDDSASLVPQSTLGRAGLGITAAGLGFQGLRVLEDRQNRLAAQAESDLVEEQANTFREVVRNEEFSSQEKARVIDELAGSGFVRSSVSGGRGSVFGGGGGGVGAGAGSAAGGSGDGGLGIIPDDPIVLIVGIIVLVIVLRSVLDESGDNGGG